MESKKKDPAFLFYSKDFYEGTRMMLPEERACFIDLLIYQHQNGFIPNDIRRLTLYCSGCSEAMLIATLEAKFKLSDKGWVNKKLAEVVQNRESFSSIQSLNGIVGQFYKKAKKQLKPSEYTKLKVYIEENYTRETLAEKLTEQKNEHEALLKAMLKHIAIANAIVDNSIDNNYIKFNHLKISKEENQKLIELGYNQNQIDMVYQKIQNYAKNTKYKSLYLTSIDWLKREYGKIDATLPKVKSIAEQMEEMRNA